MPRDVQRCKLALCLSCASQTVSFDSGGDSLHRVSLQYDILAASARYHLALTAKLRLDVSLAHSPANRRPALPNLSNDASLGITSPRL